MTMTELHNGLLDSVDPEIMTAVGARAGEIAQGAPVNSKLVAALALGSIPIALGAIARDVYGQTPTDVLDVLQFALVLEYLEADFYQRGNAAAGLIPSTDQAIFTTISNHETVHVTALQDLIRAKGATPGAKPAFDYTAQNNLPGFAFLPTQYQTFLAVAQAFEDTGVRAYKGQAGRLINDKAALTAALTIHSVEARHAAEVRKVRGQKGWVTGNSRDTLPAFTQPVYDGEENVTQGGVNLGSIASNFGGTNGASEAFDEPLTKAQVINIVKAFIPALR